MVKSSLMFSGFSSNHQNSQPNNMNSTLQNNSLSGGYRGSMLLCWTHATFSYFHLQHPAGNHAPDQTCKNYSILRNIHDIRYLEMTGCPKNSKKKRFSR